MEIKLKKKKKNEWILDYLNLKILELLPEISLIGSTKITKAKKLKWKWKCWFYFSSICYDYFMIFENAFYVKTFQIPIMKYAIK